LNKDCGILESIKKCPDLWKLAFVCGSSKAKSPDEFLDDLEVKHSQSQLRKEKEIDVFKYFCEVIQSRESDEGMKVHKTTHQVQCQSFVTFVVRPALFINYVYINYIVLGYVCEGIDTFDNYVTTTFLAWEPRSHE
jgi:hypothetical protein